MKYFKKINGEKVYLSPVNPDDYEICTKWLNNLKTTIPLGNAHLNISLAAEKEFLEKMAKSGDHHFSIIRQDDDVLLGICGLMEINHIHNHAKLGLFIGDEENRAKGFGSEAIRLLLSFGFSILNLNNIMLQVFSFNENAVRCYRNIGFRECGRRSEVYLLKGKYYDEIFMEILNRDFSPLEIF